MFGAGILAGSLGSSLNTVEAAGRLDANGVVQGFFPMSKLSADVRDSRPVLRPRVGVTVKSLLKAHYFLLGRGA